MRQGQATPQNILELCDEQGKQLESTPDKSKISGKSDLNKTFGTRSPNSFKMQEGDESGGLRRR